jgi:hypothetical protein
MVKKKTPPRRWSKQVMEKSDALDLEKNVFTKTPRQIALSLKRSAESSGRRKSSPFRSAMSMINFYQNRAGKNLSEERKEALQKAKEELRKLYGKEKRVVTTREWPGSTSPHRASPSDRVSSYARKVQGRKPKW